MSRFLEAIKREQAAAGSAPFPASLDEALKKALIEKERQWFSAIDAIGDELVAASQDETISGPELIAKIEAAAKTISEGVTLVDAQAIADALAEVMNLGKLLGRIQKRIQAIEMQKEQK